MLQVAITSARTGKRDSVSNKKIKKPEGIIKKPKKLYTYRGGEKEYKNARMVAESLSRDSHFKTTEQKKGQRQKKTKEI